MKIKNIAYFLIIVFIFFNFFTLSKPSLWVDEGHVLQLVSMEWSTFFNNLIYKGIGGIPHLFFVKIICDTLGTFEFSLRLLSFISNLILLIFFFLFIKKEFGEKISFIYALLHSFSGFLFYYSQEAREYSFTAALSTISLIFFYKFYKNPTKTNYIIALILGILSGFSHYYTFFIIFPATILILIKHTWCIQKFLKFNLFIIILLIFLIRVFLIQYNYVQTLGIQVGSLKQNIINLIVYNIRLSIGMGITSGFFSEKSNYTLLTIILMGSGAFFYLMINGLINYFKNYRNFFFPTVWIFFWLSITILNSIKFLYIAERYLIFSLPLMYFFISFAFLKSNKLKQLLLFFLIIINVFSIYNYLFGLNQKQNWRYIANYLNNNKNAAVIIIPGMNHALKYYLNKNDFSPKIIPFTNEKICEKYYIVIFYHGGRREINSVNNSMLQKGYNQVFQFQSQALIMQKFSLKKSGI